MRSCQQDELYNAQRVLPRGREFESLGQVQLFLDDLRDEPWWDELYSNVVQVDVSPAPDNARSQANYDDEHGYGDIYLRAESRCMRVIVHELAHVFATARFKSNAHDPWYASTFLELVYRLMGSEAWWVLHESFVKHGIDFDIGDSAGQGGIRL